jgi:hypothetical protein
MITLSFIKKGFLGCTTDNKIWFVINEKVSAGGELSLLIYSLDRPFGSTSMKPKGLYPNTVMPNEMIYSLTV